MALLFQIIILNILNIYNPQYLNSTNLLTILSAICNYILPFPIFYWLIKKIPTETFETRNVNAKTFIIYIGIAYTLMWIGNIIGLIITTLLSGIIQTQIANPVQNLISSSEIWFNLFIISILAPVFEEIFFRKILIDRTIKHGVKLSILLSAVIFALFHGNLNQFFYAFLIGGFFAYVYIKTGKITYTISLHVIINLMGSVMSVIFTNSVMNIQTNINPFDAFIILAYLLILFSLIVIGLYGIFKFKDKLFTKIELPYKCVFLNYGMICFMAFFIFEIIYQVFG